jgi:nucleotide-binding universal stress UspA family protein
LEERVRGTLVCGVNDSDDGSADGRVRHRGSRRARSGSGDAAALIGQMAAEEAADLIVVGSRQRGRLRRGLESRLAEQLVSETPVPVLIAPPRTPRSGENRRMNGGQR